MSIKAEIISTLEKGGIENIASVADANMDGASYLVFIPIGIDSNGNKTPSGHRLGKLKKELQEKGIGVDYVLTDGVLPDVESGLRAALLMSYGDLIRNAFFQLKGRTGDVWVDSKRKFGLEEKAKIKDLANEYLKNFGLGAEDVVSTSEDNLPTITASLKAIRLLAPISANKLAIYLRKANFVVPSDDWMNRRLVHCLINLFI